jgi:hypothetical protein
VGWQDRDWARLRDDELDALYGFRKPPSGGRGVSTRWVVWGAVAAAVIAVSGFGYTQVPRTPPVNGVVNSGPDVIYGQPTAQGGLLGVCTEMSVDVTGIWRCTSIALNTGHTRVARAAPYDGPCAHLSADQTTGRWVCISARPDGTAPEPAGEQSS